MRRIAALALVLAAVGCKRDTAIDGYEMWRFGKTTAKDGIACSERDGYTFCSQNGAVNVAGQHGQVNLFFRGHGDDAPLIEIELEFLTCSPDAIFGALTQKLGTQFQRFGKSAVVWAGERAVIFARLPADDGTCLVHFVIPEDRARLERLRKEASAHWTGRGSGEQRPRRKAPT
jgi:hypothetical protein